MEQLIWVFQLLEFLLCLKCDVFVTHGTNATLAWLSCAMVIYAVFIPFWAIQNNTISNIHFSIWIIRANRTLCSCHNFFMAYCKLSERIDWAKENHSINIIFGDYNLCADIIIINLLGYAYAFSVYTSIDHYCKWLIVTLHIYRCCNKRPLRQMLFDKKFHWPQLIGIF